MLQVLHTDSDILKGNKGVIVLFRVLQVVNNMHRAGLETMLMNYYRNIDRSRIQFDFLTHRQGKDDYDDEITELGGHIFHAPRLYPQNYPKYFKYMRNFFNQHKEYQIMHSHIDSMSYLPLRAGKKADIPVRIAHSHNTSIDKGPKYPLKCYFKSKIPEVATDYCACGSKAGQFLFPGKEYTVIPNAIDVDKFVFSPHIREKKRRELQLHNQFVIGHVGRFAYAKNHKRLIEIFNECLQRKQNVILLLIGVGEKEKEIQTLVHQMGIQKNVRFLGKRSDVNELYQAMDCFMMPSLFEGVPVVGIEAQCAGVKCIFSENVPSEVAITENCTFISLNESNDVWAKQILKEHITNDKRINISNAIYDSEYNIKNSVKLLFDYYINLYHHIDAVAQKK